MKQKQFLEDFEDNNFDSFDDEFRTDSYSDDEYDDYDFDNFHPDDYDRNEDGFDEDGFDENNIDEDGFDEDGFDEDGKHLTHPDSYDYFFKKLAKKVGGAVDNIGKKVGQHIEKKVEARAKRKEVRFNKRMERKDKRLDARLARKDTRLNRRQNRADDRLAYRHERKSNRQMARQNRKDMKLFSKVGDVRQAYEESMQKPEATLTAEQQVKLNRYVERQGEYPEQEQDLLAGQFAELRSNEIENYRQNFDAENSDEFPAYEEGEEPEEMPNEFYENELMEEEAQTFNFEGGDYYDYLDAETIGSAVAVVAKTGLDKLRQKRFSEGKKMFGQTKEQYEKNQANKAAGKQTDLEETINAGYSKIEDAKVKDYVKEHKYEIAGAAVGLLVLGSVISKFIK